MPWRPRTWFLLSLLFFIAAAWFWYLGERRANPGAAPATSDPPKISTTNNRVALLSVQQPRVASPVPTPTPPPGQEQKAFPLRLSNTSKTLKQLMRDDHALLLRNALIDTAGPADLKIPVQLQSKGEPGGYIVQAAGGLDNAFRERLRAAGATIIS